jgi:amino acid adenylation domain-containing protein
MTDRRASIDLEDIYELSPMQLGMLFQSLLSPKAGVFVEQIAVRLPSAIVRTSFERAWQAAVDRTPVLRSSFHWGDLEKPVQVVHRRVPVRVQVLDWRGVPPAGHERHVTDYLRRERSLAFELDAPPLMRLTLASASDAETWFVWQFHHLLLDGWSGQLLLKEVVDEYQALLARRPYNPPRREPFSAYIAWLQSQNEAEAEAFWRSQLQGLSAPTPVGIGRPLRAGADEGNAGEHQFALSFNQSEALRTFAKEHRLTLNTLVQGAWAMLLARYSGHRDVVHGMVVSGRPPELAGVETMIGLFINTLPLRVEVPLDADLVSWLTRLQRHQLEVTRYQYVSGLQLQRWSAVPSGTPLYDTVVVFENFPIATKGESSQRSEEPLYAGHTDSAITLLVVPEAAMGFKLLYDHRRFDAAQIAQLSRHFATLLSDLPNRTNARLGEVSLTTPAERQRVLVDWNATARPGYDRVSIAQLLADEARRNPDAIAFIDGKVSTTVSAVDLASNRLAQYLATRGIGHGTVVGVSAERSVEAVVACLALFKLRAVFLPLDQSYPLERLSYMATDARAAWVIGENEDVAGSQGRLSWDTVWPAAAECPADCPQPQATPDDVAYILYTSGSTGRPKGAAVHHRAVLNRLTSMWDQFPWQADDVGVMKTPLNFVDIFWEMLGGLLKGRPTVIAPQHIVAEPRALVELLAAHRVTRIWVVPSFLEMLLETFPDLGARLPALLFWSCGGEPLPIGLHRRFQQAVPSGTLYNMFGTSELWDVTVFDPARDGPVIDNVPIGRPIANTQTYILDARLEPTPVGVVGSLYIGGAPVSAGYVNQELTRERYIAHPFDPSPGAALYDTGDLARYRADGVIEYVGRRDLQINVRGFRVEPSEIEAQLDAHPGVRESVVVKRQVAPGDERLVAYVVANGNPVDSDVLQAYLAKSLPAFMIPLIARIDAIPMTPSGKPDRNRLPEAAPTSARARASLDMCTPLERTIAREFASILKVDRVARDDDFFAHLGGHSLVATRLVSRLREGLGIDLPLRAIFDAPTPAALAALVESRFGGTVTSDAAVSSILEDLAALPPEQAAALLDTFQAQTDDGQP